MEPLHVGTLCPPTTHVKKTVSKVIKILTSGYVLMLAYLFRRFSLDDLPLSWDALAMPISLSSDLDDRI
jgi:hypothetical protein